ncbi:Endoribonuclease YbeY, partial [Bienertia sinuspersici]
GDHSKHVDEGVSVSSPKDGQLIVADTGATGIIPQPVEDSGLSLPIVTPLNVQRLHDDGSYSSISRSARIPDVAIPEYIRENTPEKDKQKINRKLFYTDEDIKKEFGEEVGKNVMEDVHKEEKEIADHKNDDSFIFETEVSKKGKAESKYKDVLILSIDEHNPAVIQKNEELRHTLESLVLLDIINPANPDIHNYINWLIDERKKKEYIESIIADKEIDLEKAKDNPCYDTMKAEWLKDKQKMTYRDSTFFADKCRQSMSEWEKIFLQGNRIKRRGFDGLHHWNRRTIPFTWRSNQNDFDCGVYCIKAMECYDGWNEKKHPITTFSTAYTKNLSRCHLAIGLVSYKENRRKLEVFKDCALWSARKPFLIEQQK